MTNRRTSRRKQAGFVAWAMLGAAALGAITGNRRNKQAAGAADRVARQQEENAKAAAKAQATAANAAAQAAADQQRLVQERALAEEKARAVVEAPLESASVDLDTGDNAGSAAAQRRRRNATFGTGYANTNNDLSL